MKKTTMQAQQVVLPAIHREPVESDRPLSDEQVITSLKSCREWEERKRVAPPSDEEYCKVLRYKHSVLQKDLVQRQPNLEAPPWALLLIESVKEIKENCRSLSNRFIVKDNKRTQVLKFPIKISGANAGSSFRSIQRNELFHLNGLQTTEIFDFYGNEIAEEMPRIIMDRNVMIAKFLGIVIEPPRE